MNSGCRAQPTSGAAKAGGPGVQPLWAGAWKEPDGRAGPERSPGQGGGAQRPAPTVSGGSPCASPGPGGEGWPGGPGWPLHLPRHRFPSAVPSSGFFLARAVPTARPGQQGPEPSCVTHPPHTPVAEELRECSREPRPGPARQWGGGRSFALPGPWFSCPWTGAGDSHGGAAGGECQAQGAREIGRASCRERVSSPV